MVFYSLELTKSKYMLDCNHYTLRTDAMFIVIRKSVRRSICVFLRLICINVCKEIKRWS